MTITVVGIGLIGGSLALSLRKNGFGTNFIGVDNNEIHRSDAMWLGIVDEVLPLKDAVCKSDIVILSIPVNAAKKTLIEILDVLGAVNNDKTVVVDMGSTKKGICSESENHPRRMQYVASHPIAGTEFSGPKAAIDNLFEGKKTIICDKELSSDYALDIVLQMYQSIGMDVSYMSSDIHDKHIAFVSHISHISSFALGITVLNIEKDEKNIFTMAGSGFDSTVRLAKSSPETWAPIFIQNTDSILFALNNYIQQLEEFKVNLENKDSDKLKELMKNANEIKRILF
ncbi:MAG: prephenate dehydrogenase [Prevotellaceae bacterium]|jgi:prephenate dehydrogenase|nr:prephenate dehydrogenase [Prevotellaceae bacterium]